MVSNREPYLHTWRMDGSITVQPTTGGLSVALDADAGRADVGRRDKRGYDVVDANDRIAVPAEIPSCTLRRVWLSEEREPLHHGFANEGLKRRACACPPALPQRWTGRRIAASTALCRGGANELTEPPESVFIRTIISLVAGELRQLEPRVHTAFFCTFRAPSDRLRICPWRREIKGLLANDVMRSSSSTIAATFCSASGTS